MTSDVRAYGHPKCATCGGRGVRFGVDHRPAPCVPCTSERREAAERVFGYFLECRGCEAVLTVDDHGGRRTRPKTWATFGPLCGPCLAETPRIGSERESA